jgi:hypothetical protein
MARINIRADGRFVGWFDPDKAAESYHDGAEAIYWQTGGSKPSQNRRWVLESGGDYRFISDDEAAEWLTSHGMNRLANDDEEPRDKGGRPEIGNIITLRLGGWLPVVDELAARRHMSRSDCLRYLIQLGYEETTRQEPA